MKLFEKVKCPGIEILLNCIISVICVFMCVVFPLSLHLSLVTKWKETKRFPNILIERGPNLFFKYFFLEFGMTPIWPIYGNLPRSNFFLEVASTKEPDCVMKDFCCEAGNAVNWRPWFHSSSIQGHGLPIQVQSKSHPISIELYIPGQKC